MPASRRSAIVHLELPSSATAQSLPLTRERNFGVYLKIEDKVCPATHFRSPINDELWREFTRQLRDCNINRNAETGYRGAEFIRTLGRDLYQSLVALSPDLAAFLDDAGTPRRLVIQTTRPELHVLPWGALFDLQGRFLSSGDLSIVQCWAHFSASALMTGPTLNLVAVLGADTNKASAFPLRSLPAEILRDPAGSPDILHIEEHGNAVLNSIGKATAPSMARRFATAKLALLWSCYSSAANSWGESPALCLHREGAALVLSFQAELHYQDAKSIAQSFYADVFGPAATRDPESALVRIRAAKFDKEFENANWASMTVFLREPLDLSAVPLNGPRVPSSAWQYDSATPQRADDPEQTHALLTASWLCIEELVRRLVPGTVNAAAPSPDCGPAQISPPTLPAWPAKIPDSPFAAWRGNVIRLDGGKAPLASATLAELNLNLPRTRSMGPADALVWFFEQIASYGSPLIVWTNCTHWHRLFVETLRPRPSLTFLLLYADPPKPTLSDLVDLNLLSEARAAWMDRNQRSSSQAEQSPAIDAELAAAYFAFARSEMPGPAADCLSRISDPAEALLLRANYVSRFCRLPEFSGPPLSELEQQQTQEDLYRAAMLAAQSENATGKIGRARHQLGYLLQTQGRSDAAQALYATALAELDRGPADAISNLSLAMLLRDWADVVATDPASTAAQIADASRMLARSLALHTFHGRPLEIGYCLTTSARLARATGLQHSAAALALDAANRFEECSNWRAWSAAFFLLLEILLADGQHIRTLALTHLGSAKLAPVNLGAAHRHRVSQTLLAYRAKAQWIAGDIDDARATLLLMNPENDSLPLSTELSKDISSIRRFLGACG